MKIRQYALFFIMVAVFLGCSDKEEPACGNEEISARITAAAPCTGEGTIALSPISGEGVKYKLGTGAFQLSPIFNGLHPGKYEVTVQFSGNCIERKQFEVPQPAAGPLFAAVRGVLAANCLDCHSGNNPQAGMNFSVDCDILKHWDRIRARAVDGNPSPMPQAGLMPLSERRKIIDWLNAGHRYID